MAAGPQAPVAQRGRYTQVWHSQTTSPKWLGNLLLLRTFKTLVVSFRLQTLIAKILNRLKVDKRVYGTCISLVLVLVHLFSKLHSPLK